MADKVSSLVITVDLSCCRSFKKIRKTLCKLQESEDIRAIVYDDKAGTVTVSGGFDPLVLPCKLHRRAGSVIKDIHLKEERKKQEAPPPPPPPPPPAPASAARAFFCSACGTPTALGSVCLCHAHCHGCGCRCCSPAPLCYGAPNTGGRSCIQCAYDEPSPICSIM
ncbi:protein PYRICULARIA ORYZAE RESISTANCE 21-like [Oryza brachyantha]|uniref:protein PYRICULARIA ORYZAE RESISTANCE 21-like n=1 Tax=Oryza brachyantha TaxID=4533 RepID=UPI001ADB4229|nr:protein PYRICULARIA ORYZAE RESISTANCE 21-like [Oryza brachyantha]